MRSWWRGRGRPYIGLGRQWLYRSVSVLSVVAAMGSLIVIPTLTIAAANDTLRRLDLLGSNAWTMDNVPAPGEALHPVAQGGAGRLDGLHGVSDVLHVGRVIDADVQRSRYVPIAIDVSVYAFEQLGTAPEATIGAYRPVTGFNLAVVGSAAAQRLHINSLPANLLVGKQRVAVVGVIKNDPLLGGALDSSVLLPFDMIRRAGWGLASESFVVRGQAVDPRELVTAVQPWGGSHLTVAQPTALINTRGQIQNALSGLSLASIVAALVLALVTVCASSVAGVRRRTAEIALRRIHGASSGRIASGVALESMIVGFCGGLLGTVISISTVSIVASQRDWPISFSPTYILTCFGILLLLSIIAALIPAYVAVRVQPIRALSVE